jgi:hypothetical protein
VRAPCVPLFYNAGGALARACDADRLRAMRRLPELIALLLIAACLAVAAYWLFGPPAARYFVR